MLMFRKMTIDDLDKIYKDIELRPLLTIPPIGKKFGVVVDLDNCIVGGVTGYIEGENATIQKLIMKAQKDYTIYEDGLIRSLIHTLDLDGVRFLFVEPLQDVNLYTNIGFKKFNSCMANSANNTFYIDLKAFFCEQNC